MKAAILAAVLSGCAHSHPPVVAKSKPWVLTVECLDSKTLPEAVHNCRGQGLMPDDSPFTACLDNEVHLVEFDTATGRLIEYCYP